MVQAVLIFNSHPKQKLYAYLTNYHEKGLLSCQFTDTSHHKLYQIKDHVTKQKETFWKLPWDCAQKAWLFRINAIISVRKRYHHHRVGREERLSEGIQVASPTTAAQVMMKLFFLLGYYFPKLYLFLFILYYMFSQKMNRNVT